MVESSKNIADCWYSDKLICPDCLHRLDVKGEVHCAVCGYKAGVSMPIEIKPRVPKPLSLEMCRVSPNSLSEVLDQLETSRPKISYTGPQAVRDSRELMSQMSSYLTGSGTVLDLGCGPRDQAVAVEWLGHKYVGVDYSNTNADLLADAHALPFESAMFDCVLSYAVLEHLHNPIIAIQEIERVLKPGGVYIGTVSQGEPFHDSYFHMTPWGLISLLSSNQVLKIMRLWSAGDTLHSLSRMGRYPRVIKQLIRVVGWLHDKFPFLAPRRMRLSKKERELDNLFRSGSLCFTVRKKYK